MRNLLILTLLVSACGAAKTSDDKDAAASPASPGPFSVTATDVSKLPTCNAERAGALGYISTEKKFYACESDAWTAIDPTSSLDIADEPAGTNCEFGGKAVRSGTETKYICNAAGGRFSTIISCDATKTYANAVVSMTAVVNFTYKVALTDYGDAFVSGKVKYSQNEAVDSAFFSKDESSIATTPLSVGNASVATLGLWTLTLDRSTLILSATRSSTGIAETFPASACTKTSY